MAKLARAEQAVEKYQKKLEEMLELKKQNKDLCDKMDQYLDQIHSLESANKVHWLLDMCLFSWSTFLCEHAVWFSLKHFLGNLWYIATVLVNHNAH